MKLSTLLIVLIAAVIITAIVVFAIGGNKTLTNQPTINLTPTVTSSLISESKNIEVNSLKANQSLKPPIVIKGKARVFENSVSYRLKDASGNITTEGNVMANAPDIGSFGDFEITISTVLKGKMTIEVLSFSAKDGSEIDKVIIPVVLE